MKFTEVLDTVGRCGTAWCTDHQDGTCRTETTSPLYGRIIMTYSPEEGVRILLYGTEEELTPAAAEALARTLRGHVTASQGLQLDHASDVLGHLTTDQMRSALAYVLGWSPEIFAGAIEYAAARHAPLNPHRDQVPCALLVEAQASTRHDRGEDR